MIIPKKAYTSICEVYGPSVYNILDFLIITQEDRGSLDFITSLSDADAKLTAQEFYKLIAADNSSMKSKIPPRLIAYAKELVGEATYESVRFRVSVPGLVIYPLILRVDFGVDTANVSARLAITEEGLPFIAKALGVRL